MNDYVIFAIGFVVGILISYVYWKHKLDRTSELLETIVKVATHGDNEDVKSS